MNSLLNSWLLKVEDVSNGIQAKEQELRAQLDENEELESVLKDELRRKTVACKNLSDLNMRHAQLHSRALLCAGKGHANSHTASRSVLLGCQQLGGWRSLLLLCHLSYAAGMW